MPMHIILSAVAGAFFLVAGTPVALGQCVSSAKLSCAVYEQCFAKYCPCRSGSEYFMSYGKRYCEQFIKVTDFSEAGQGWRDSTLRCLQETIVPKLPKSENELCDCERMKVFAFDLHVACYTRAGSSICNLPRSDWAKISSIIKAKDALSADGKRNMCDILKVCEGQTSIVVNRGYAVEQAMTHAIIVGAREVLCPYEPRRCFVGILVARETYYS